MAKVKKVIDPKAPPTREQLTDLRDRLAQLVAGRSDKATVDGVAELVEEVRTTYLKPLLDQALGALRDPRDPSYWDEARRLTSADKCLEAIGLLFRTIDELIVSVVTLLDGRLMALEAAEAAAVAARVSEGKR